MNRTVEKVIVLGGGSAGLLAALALKRRIPHLSVELIRFPDNGDLMVGEGSTPTLPSHLHGYLGCDPADFHATVRPTYKLGSRFHWGPRPRFHFGFSNQQLDYQYFRLPKPNGFYCDQEFDFADINSVLMAQEMAFERREDGFPVLTNKVAYHLENAVFHEFLERELQSSGVTITDDTLLTAETDATGVKELKLRSGRTISADLYVDCSGFRSELLGKALNEPYLSFASSLPCDRAVVGDWPRSNEPLLAFTTIETMNAGWAWRIEHDHLINCGYVYSSAFLSDEEAEDEFREKNPLVTSTRIVPFQTGRYRRNWVKNVVAIGDSAGFVDPLEATSLATIVDMTQLVVTTLNETNCMLQQPIVDLYNIETAESWDEIRRMLALHYRFNGRIDSEFWQHCADNTDLAGVEPIVEHYREVGPSTTYGQNFINGRNGWGWEAYLVWLLGPQAPTNHTYRPGSQERAAWAEIQGTLRVRAAQAMDQEEALLLIRSDLWEWDPEFYPTE